jgi:hypothetical protein
MPMEDTHESVVFVPFLIWGLGLPIFRFFVASSISTLSI